MWCQNSVVWPSGSALPLFNILTSYSTQINLHTANYCSAAVAYIDPPQWLSSFFSPQFIINHPDAQVIFIECSNSTTLCVVALDEAHIHVQHGTSFWSKIWALQVNFFSKIFGSQQPKLRPWLITLTATMPTPYLPLLTNLLTISPFLVIHSSELPRMISPNKRLTCGVSSWQIQGSMFWRGRLSQQISYKRIHRWVLSFFATPQSSHNTFVTI